MKYLKHKYDFPIQAEELNELLIANREDKIWQQKVNSKWVFVNLLIEFVMAGVFIYVIRDLVNIIVSILLTLPTLLLVYKARTMKYSILADEILFEWGILWFRKKVSIPFKDITAINLVEYNNSEDSTIFFGTKSSYKIKKINFDRNEPRPHITFENVKNGKKVKELLNLLWHRSKLISELNVK